MSEESTETIVEEETTAAEDVSSLPATAPENLEELKPKMKVKGTVKRLELYGAFIDIGVGVNALIHISQLGNEHVNRVSDVVNVNDEVEVWIDKVDIARQQVMVTMVEPMAVDWRDLKVGQVYSGKISRLEDFGAFVDIGAEREGLVHISELSHGFVKHPGEVLSVGNEVEVQVLNFSKRKRRIDLSIKALQDKPDLPEQAPRQTKENESAPRRQHQQKEREREKRVTYADFDDTEAADEMPTAMEIAMRKAMGESLPDRSKGAGRKRKRQAKLRDQQEDILNRTLQLQQDE
jgi:small subunit ribosomal protein S1